ncbi:MAG TPA: excinuclease ABC subunit A, partial [Armatimonadetes bacterium]|nr:excinuclease ABC subunit A [Armatimonadota bacterium]
DGSTDYHFAGVVNQLTELYETGHYARDLAALIRDLPCPACGGERVRAEARVVRLRGKTIKEITDLTLREALEFFTGLELTEGEQEIVGEVMREIRTRLRFLCDLGLDYLTLSRPAPTLSGGEAQRIRLASQIGSGLTGVLYVLDEPTIGLHPRDTQRLLTALKHLRDLGNTVIVVEHDAETIRNADFILDFGPGAGINGGRIVAQGSPAEVARQGHSLTGQYLSGRKSIPLPRRRRAGNGLSLVVRGARHHNLKNIDVRFPLGTFICVTGVSGSGKSSLVNEVLYRALANELHRARYSPGQHEGLEGVEYIDKVIAIDQSPIGTTPRSDPATYVGVFDEIRALYAMLPESRARGYTPARFSFNRPGGRCEACWGYGYRKIEMHFLADVWVKCEVCNGARYNQETLQIKYRDQSIADVLNMTVAEAREHFAEIPRVRRILQTLADVGLDYLRLGQSAPTLSGGEAQRVKLAKELSRPSTGQTLYLLDEPTTGLHFEDVKRLLEVLNRLVDAGNTVVCIEHNLEVIKTADYIIDLGPEGGEEGGYVVAAGPPEEVAACEESHTGRILREYLPPNRGEPVVIVREASTPYPVKPLSRAERWHKLHLAFAQERDALWTGEDLQAFIDLVREVAPEVSAPNWEHPEYVELRVEGVKRWWCRIKTTHPIYFRVMLRAGRNPFGEGELRQRLGLQPWLALEPPVECRTPRVAVKRRPEGWEVWLHLWSRREFDTAALREVIREMVEGFKTPSM